ncbi:MAG: ABC transporter permease, partial [Candidatus Adiutrix sp.]|nr:ABC transporter permease [Candidatus Adiutrix sp.]
MAEARKSGRKPFALIWRLVLADLRHEWLLSLCMILAIASILAPLLILFGLKFGTIETFRYRLLEDPKNREMRPLTSRPYEQDWFADVRAWPGVAFVIPYTRQMSAGLDAYPDSSAAAPVNLDVIPSGPGDVWLATFRLPIPGEGQAVLSAPAAEALGAAPGAKLRVAVKKILGSKIEQAETTLDIVGVFQDGGPERPAIFTTLPFLEQVEAYKDGRAVPELGWPGVQPLARPVFTAALLRSPEKLGPVMEYRTINNTGFVAV